ncbi:Rieske (2Fe-2S) protein [Nocardioidaceae bacterium]|nr:Rieske (2Fe-2S) protein [Nocardioidaceae bacterium]
MSDGPYEKPKDNTVQAAGSWAVGRANRADFATSRRCRHLGADLAGGSVENGCLVCPWHGANYDVTSGRMVKGPQGIFAKIPGLGLFFKSVTRVLPLKVGSTRREKDGLYVD